MVVHAVAEAARALGLEGQRVLVAVSGGVDSTVLLHALHASAGELDLDLRVGHVDHGLRGEASRADAEAVRSLGERLGLPVYVEPVDPQALRAPGPSRSRPSLQEAARTLRYAALRGLARRHGAGHVATAHTLDDQAETVLLRLLRGCGPAGLGGIPERSPDGVVVRPLLGVSRRAVEQHARRERLPWREDPSNGDVRYARGRLRRGGLPALCEALNPRWLRAVADLAEAQRRDAEWIEPIEAREAERFVREEATALALARRGWEGLPAGLARRLARRALRAAGGSRDVSRMHLERVVGFLCRGRTGSRLELPGGLELACERDAFRLRRIGVHGAAGC